jgi:hypothetical protein
MDTLVEGSQQRAETPTPTTNLKYSPKSSVFHFQEATVELLQSLAGP